MKKTVKTTNRPVTNVHLKGANGSRKCPDSNNYFDNILLLSRIGTESINGEVIKACYPLTICKREKSKSKILITAKKIPMRQEEIDLINARTKKEAMVTSLWGEIMCLELCNILVKHRVCPNLPMFLKYYICDDCEYSNENLEDFNHQKCVYLINEFANTGDLKNWLKDSRSKSEWKNMFFQVFVGLYALQKYFNITHHDLHWGNILVHKVKSGGYYKYIIDSKVYYLPNNGWLFTLWDFGYAYSPDNLEIKINRWSDPTDPGRLLTDYKQVISLMDYAPSDMGEYKDKLYSYPSTFTLKEIIPDLCQELKLKPNGNIMGSYSLDKKIKLPAKFSWWKR